MDIGLLDTPDISPATRTEAVQHGIFKYGIIPLGVYGILSLIMWRNRKIKDSTINKDKKTPPDAGATEPDDQRNGNNNGGEK